MQHSNTKGYVVFKPKKSVRKSDPLTAYHKSAWFETYKRVWSKIENQLQSIGDDVMKVLLDDIVSYVGSTPSDSNLIPAVLLLTGVNLPDHGSLFDRLRCGLEATVSPHVAMLSSSDALNLKHTIELIVSQFILNRGSISESVEAGDSQEDEEMELEEDDAGEGEVRGRTDGPTHQPPLKRADTNLPHLRLWYQGLRSSSTGSGGKKLVIVFKDFEGFQPNVLHKLISILSGYLSELPIVLVFGVATTEAAIGESLTHQITSKLSLKVFQSQPSVYFLNNTIDKVFLSPDCPFQLSGKLLKFFTDVFLLYDFSVHQFIQGIKYCVMDHFFDEDRVALLCDEEKEVRKKLVNTDPSLLKELESFPSLSDYLQNRKEISNWNESESLTKPEIMFIVSNLRKNIVKFYAVLRILYTLSKDLPRSPLGKQFRELYCLSMSKDISKTPEFSECQQLLNFISKDELEKKISEIQAILADAGLSELREAEASLSEFKSELEKIGLKADISSSQTSPTKIDLNVKNRSQLKQRLAEMRSRSQQTKTGYEGLRDRAVRYLMSEFLPHWLRPYTEASQLWEAVVISCSEARGRVVPRIRAPLHAALNNPHHYLQCECCEITDDNSILASMPDISIAYKLHLEAGPLINIYDWLQSFSMIIGHNCEKKNLEEVDEVVQARFTQSLAELEFLGFVKSSTRKADHVSRLTWGGNS